MSDVTLRGGLDLTTPASRPRPGTLRSCLNYEVATKDGYSRILGIERFDGTPPVSGFKLVQLGFPSALATFALREVVQVASSGIDGVITSVDVVGAAAYVTAVFPATQPAITPGQTLASSTSSVALTSADVVFEPRGQQADLNFALDYVAAARRATITEVPGRAGSDVIGGWFLKNAAYAVRDLPTISFEGGYYTPDAEGQYLELGDGIYHQILDVAVTGEESGVITYDPVSVAGPVDVATPIGTPTLTALAVGGSLDGGFTTIPYADGLSVSGGFPPYAWSVLGEEEAAEVSAIGDLGDIDFLAEVTPAMAWRATSSGWVMASESRELSFSGGRAALRNPPRSLELDPADVQSTAVLYPTDSELDGTTTTAPNADDGTALALTGTGARTIVCRGFDFTAIPADAQIIGIEVEVERGGTNAADIAVTLVGLPGNAADKAGGAWPTVAATKVYGGDADLWGLEILKASALKASTFGVQLVVGPASGGTISGSVDFVRVTATYAARGGKPIYFWDGATDVPATMLLAQFTSGDTVDNDAAGWMTISCATNADKPRLIRAGDEIRSAPAGGGDLLATATSTDRRVFLPGQLEVDNNRSRYIAQQMNFFAQDRYDAIYGVTGAGPAFSYDGQSLIKIRAPLSPADDLPRHIAKHGDLLVLGYLPGACIATAPGNPFEVRGELGASSIEIGDRLTNLIPLAGDAIGIIGTQRSVALRGLTQQSFFSSPISNSRGGIEYTAVDMGRVIVADSFGLFAADTPESFGGAARNYISASIESWLRPRLQAQLNEDQRLLRPIAAMRVRAKNQYRLFFRDGWCLTMTDKGDGFEPTTQRLYAPAASPFEQDTPWPVRAIFNGIDASGRERVFLSFEGIKTGHLFEAEAGNTLDGDPIIHRIELNPLVAGSGDTLAHWSNFFLYGEAHGVASLEIGRGTNYDEPTSGTLEFEFGRSSAAATIRQRPARGYVDFPIEGYDLVVTLGGSTTTEAPHTLQMLKMDIDSRGESRGHRGD